MAISCSSALYALLIISEEEYKTNKNENPLPRVIPEFPDFPRIFSGVSQLSHVLAKLSQVPHISPQF